MNLLKNPFVVGAGIIVAAIVSVAVIVAVNTCSPAPEKEPALGSQGFRIWSGPTLKSFDHQNKKICVPEGWEAVGATESGKGWAKFEPNLTGVLVRTAAFGKVVLQFEQSSYVVTVYYPGTERTPLVERYLSAITNAFERTGRVFADSKKNPTRPHAVLITPGIEGATSARGPIAVYPDPGPALSIFVQSIDSARGEELFIHGITHVYNRFRPDLLAYQKSQSPIPAEDWQELEAVWAETAFRPSAEDRKLRLLYLYSVHAAVTKKDFTLIAGEPFNNREAFDRITQSVIVGKNATYLDAQYGHYVLGALSLVATEGLMKKYGARTDMETLLRALHKDKTKNFFTELEKILPAQEVKNVQGWMLEGKTIPRDLVFSAYAQ